jgi:hypothetical protein
MHAVAKKLVPRSRRAVAQVKNNNGDRTSVKRSASVAKLIAKPKRRKLGKKLSRSTDAAKRKRIGRTLDNSGFLTYHKRNAASARYWETQE